MPRKTNRPSGTVTFLFTDIEGSTRLAQDLGDDRWQLVSADHRRLLRQAAETTDGVVYQDQGESFLIVFERAKDAVLGAVAAQRALTTHSWPDGRVLRVRMAVHSGEPALAGNDYAGVDLHRAARICAAGHGGQVLLSETTRGLIADAVPDGLALGDLGEHRLKDLSAPQRVFQLVAPGLPSEFAPLKSLNARPNNLPIQLTSFIGREREIAEIRNLPPTTRLLTLTGAGGSGKTRLAFQVAAELLESFPDGVWLVELARISEATLVPQTVISALRIQEEPGRPLVETLLAFLRGKTLLLVLDNCEHLLRACAELAHAILRTCPDVRILATSRERLGIAGEVMRLVPSLSSPDIGQVPALDHLRDFEAVRLFLERATAVSSTFVVTNQNARAVAHVCARLDGIPLALELAAARVNVLSPEQMAKRLDDRFRLLTGGSRMELPRHQTLRATLDWSYDLLSEPERRLLRRLSVFSGGFSLEAAEAICAGDDVEPFEVLDVLGHLVNKSLVVAEDQGGDLRYRLLETVRQYARDKLEVASETAATSKRHRDFFLTVVEKAQPQMLGTAGVSSLNRLQMDYDNMRVALEWSLKAGDAEAGLRLAGKLWFFWYVRGYVSEGRAFLAEALSAESGASASARAEALVGAAFLASRQGDFEQAVGPGEESLALCRELGDKRGVARALTALGVVERDRSNYDRAVQLHKESLALFRELGDTWWIALLLGGLGFVAVLQGADEQASVFCEESLALFRKVGNAWGISFVLTIRGRVAMYQDDTDRAKALLEESVALSRESGDRASIAGSLHILAELANRGGDFERAAKLSRESLNTQRELGDRRGVARCLEEMSKVASAQEDWKRAVQLAGAAGALRESIGAPLPPRDRGDYDRLIAKLRGAFGEDRFSAAHARGRAMTLEQEPP